MPPGAVTKLDPEPTMNPTILTLEDVHNAADAISTAELCQDLDLRDTIARVATAIKQVSVGDMPALLAATRKVISLASRTEVGTKFVTPAAADQAHRYRNVFAAIISLAGDLYDGDPRALLTDVAKISTPRPGGRLRPLTADEVLLLRVYTTHLMRTLVRVEPAVTYLLTEAGAHPSEATTITPEHLNPADVPSRVQLPGVPNLVPAREVTIPIWGRLPLLSVLSQHCARHSGARTTPIAYRGTKRAGGHVASACASGNLRRLFREVGINDGHTTATSVLRWRIAATHRSGGLKAAAALRGLDAPKDALRIRINEFHRAA